MPIWLYTLEMPPEWMNSPETEEGLQTLSQKIILKLGEIENKIDIYSQKVQIQERFIRELEEVKRLFEFGHTLLGFNRALAALYDWADRMPVKGVRLCWVQG